MSKNKIPLTESVDAQAEHMVVAAGVEKAFGNVSVLKGIDLEVHHGEVIVLLGSSGSGKSTFLRCINRLIDPDAGRIVVGGVDMTGQRVDLPAARRGIGFVAQSFDLYPHMTALQNVMEGPVTVLHETKADARTSAEALLKRVGLLDKADVRPQALSGGQKQRVAIARALAMRPALMLFDEPTSALDPDLTGEVLDVMKQLADEGMTMIVATHEMQFARRVADRVVLLHSGRVIEQGPPKEFFDHPREEPTKRFLSRLLSWETE